MNLFIGFNKSTHTSVKQTTKTTMCTTHMYITLNYYSILQLEGLINKNGVMKTLARKAYLSFLRCYKLHPLKKIFNIKSLDLKLAAQAFGFLEQPHVDFCILL